MESVEQLAVIFMILLHGVFFVIVACGNYELRDFEDEDEEKEDTYAYVDERRVHNL